MEKNEFFSKYEALGGVLAGNFHDGIGGDTDSAIAESVLKELGSSQADLRLLVSDCERLIQNVESEWGVLGDAANRHFEDADEARAWLAGIFAVWEKALREIDGTKPS